jgi:hypothetical protein
MDKIYDDGGEKMREREGGRRGGREGDREKWVGNSILYTFVHTIQS